ncbi:methyltransferase domain-containing protein [Ectothiorhodospiraceae bacterium BW-2]|nr:methyltransferase domain-containing protein [Ectothiorhodospiraceae bacterium BW-2]
MAPLYDRFLPYLPATGHILDVGCGSGRDSRAFMQRGYSMTATEPVETLATIAEAWLGGNRYTAKRCKI